MNKGFRWIQWMLGLLVAAALGLWIDSVAAAEAGFRLVEISPQSLELREGGKPVLAYNHGIMTKSGVSADFYRGTYIHPLYGLDGEILTDDFPADHYHHRGLFWAWPHVKIGGSEYDLWALKGIEQKFERWTIRQTGAARAVLGVQNGWYVGKDKIMDERVRIIAHPAQTQGRAIDLEFVWTPVSKPISLAGAEGKSYGGLTLRYAPGTNTAITIPSGLAREDLYMTNLAWADLSRTLAAYKRDSGAAIFIHPSHPDYPPTWLTRHYGVLCLGWPGVQPQTFEPGKPIQCKYRIWIHRGLADLKNLSTAYEEYLRSTSGKRPGVKAP